MNLHEGHRNRLRRRFIKEGARSFEPHNLLELLLFYGIPRQDTNEIAHRLIERFGNLKVVLTAPHEELCNIEGVGDYTATLLRLCGELGAICFATETKNIKRFNNYDEMGEYFVDVYGGVTEETVYLMLLSADSTVLKIMPLFKGNVNSTSLKVRDIVALTIRANAAMVVLAHNHPGGRAFPSNDDLTTTRLLYDALSVNDVELLEHFVISDKSFCGILHQSRSDDKECGPRKRIIT